MSRWRRRCSSSLRQARRLNWETSNALAELITNHSAYLVDRAKAETLHLWQDDDRAATLMKRWG